MLREIAALKCSGGIKLSCMHKKEIELARINLAYVRAEILGSREASEDLKRILRHIEEADTWLKAAAPEFDHRPAASHSQPVLTLPPILIQS